VTNEVVYEKVLDDIGKNQILIFVHGRKETARTARAIRELAMDKGELDKLIPIDSGSKGVLEHESRNVKTTELRDLLSFGIGIHHAGLPQSDRSTVEDLFAARHLNVCVATLTLAWGVNLPAHTVIIKGTQIYMPEKGDWVELSPMDMLQMIGRAGRPQYDTSGHGIVITNKSELQYYLSLNNMQLPIESQMMTRLVDFLNAEISLGTISTRNEAARWLGYTYLYVRMLRNPGLYGIPLDEVEKDSKLIQRRVDLVHAALSVLEKNGLVKYDRKSGQIQGTILGRVASHYYLRTESIAIYNSELKANMSDIDLIRLFSLSMEFKYIPVREEEKVELSKLVELVPIPIKGGAEDSTSKINVLLQAYVSRLSLEGFALMSDMVFVTQNAGRLFRALFEICIRRGWSSVARKCLTWCKCIELRMWPIQTQLRHFKSVGDDVCRRVERRGMTNEEFGRLSSEEIGEVIRAPKIGRQIRTLLDQIPKFGIVAYVQPITRSTLSMRVEIKPEFEYSNLVHAETEYFWLLVEDVTQQYILYSDQVGVKSFQIKKKQVLVYSFTVAVTEPVPPYYFVRLISDKWMGSETVRPVSFRSLILPEKSIPPTQIEDLEFINIRRCNFVYRDPMLRNGIEYLNSIQTQAHDAVYNGADNLVLCGPMSSGKSLMIDIAIWSMMQKNESHRCVYIAPNEELSRHKFYTWTSRYPEWRIEHLTGDSNRDLKISETSSVIIATPSQWDLISRKWKTKRVKALIESIGLFVADYIHMATDSSTYELVVSRMRHVSVGLSCSMRLMLVGTSVLNILDLAGWIGAKSVFNFPPHSRSIPIEIFIHGFDHFNRDIRQLSMLKPLYTQLCNRADGAIIFATDRRHCRLTAADLVLQAVSDGKPYRWLQNGPLITSQVTDEALVVALEHGIGYIHGGQSEVEKSAVLEMYQSGVISVLMVSHENLWSLGSVRAHTVVVLDTCVYSLIEGQYIDIAIPDVLQMISHAGRPGIDNSGNVIIFCATSKREYYKKFVSEPIPVESALDMSLGDIFNGEIANGSIRNRQDCIDWLTWSLYYRRLSGNPNYYSLTGKSHEDIADYLSSLIEETIEGLVNSGMIIEDDEEELVASDLGLIASYYAVTTTTIEMFNKSVTATSKRKQLIEILANASEFSVGVISDEESILFKMANALKLNMSGDISLSNKILILLHAHFNRFPLTADLQSDLDKRILPTAHRLVLALVDVISTCGWLKVALAAMEIGPMIVQAVTPSSSPLLQLPYFDDDRVKISTKKFGVEDIVDFLSADDSVRNQLLAGLSEQQVSSIAKACNMYPSIELSSSILSNESEEVIIEVTLEREGDLILDQRGTFVPIFSQYYPKEKEESWWLVIGQNEKLVDIKRISITKEIEKIVMKIFGNFEIGYLKVFLMSDSYIGCDQEKDLS
jgi:pre-mRNA-splicing helicase BRR2